MTLAPMLARLALPIQEAAQGTDPAATPPPKGFLDAIPWIPLVLIFAVFYFVLIAPERKQRKRREQLLSALKKGDKVMTTGGLLATVAAVQEDVVTLQVADGVRLRYSRQAVQTVMGDEAEAKDERNK